MDIIRIVSLTDDEINVIVEGIEKDFLELLKRNDIELPEDTIKFLMKYVRAIATEHLEPFK